MDNGASYTKLSYVIVCSSLNSVDLKYVEELSLHGILIEMSKSVQNQILQFIIT